MRDALLPALLLMDQLHLTADSIFSLFCLLSQLQPELAAVLKFFNALFLSYIAEGYMCCD
jgi:hypothetical protein